MKDNYLTVTALTKYIKRKIDLDPHLNEVWLKGEISNFNHHSRGHMYLTIKDQQTRVQAVMFAGSNRKLKFTPENGMNVLIKGEISVFEPFGQYQLYIQDMEPDGIGSLYLAYEQLKEKLNKEGLFSNEFKRPLPTYPKRIAVITSPTGAAIRDIITTLTRRYPLADVIILPSLVQGDAAAYSIAKAIEQANDMEMFDLIILGRGGGSIEDLWAFNEEVVARAIFQSQLPIVSAVGHETDNTISDFVADLRAATPTGAAELAVPSQIELKQKNIDFEKTLTFQIKNKIEENQKHLSRLKQSYAFKYPEHLIRQKEQELDRLSNKINQNIRRELENKHEKLHALNRRLKNQFIQNKFEESFLELTQLNKRLETNMRKNFDFKKTKLVTILEKLTLLNPLEIMKRGFALPYDSELTLIKTVNNVEPEDNINLKISDGTILCKVLEVEERYNV